jgi:alkanesulfonate monooxygenase SsuD/methylene tetrahydromethanopterin reductase-like flavin-dependent oxidoreductase (luciferase family)
MKAYRQALKDSGHENQGDAYLRVPIYVGETDQQGMDEPRESTVRSYQRLAENFRASANAAGTTASEERRERYERLSSVTYDELLEDRLAYGSPDTVARKLKHLISELGLSGVIMEPNVGGQLTEQQVLNSIRRYGEEVAPQLRK